MNAGFASVLILGALAASSASAQTYIGGSFGDSGDMAMRFFGGYAFTPYLSAEIGFGTLGTVSASTGESADLSMADLSLIASRPIGNRFSMHARLGAYYGATEVPTTRAVANDNAVPCPVAPPGFPQPLCPPPASSSERGWQGGHNSDLTYGLGLDYAMTETGTLRIEWQRFQNFGGGGGPKLDVDLFSIGVLVHVQ